MNICKRQNKKNLSLFRVARASFAGCNGFGCDRFIRYENTENHDRSEKGFYRR